MMNILLMLIMLIGYPEKFVEVYKSFFNRFSNPYNMYKLS